MSKWFLGSEQNRVVVLGVNGNGSWLLTKTTQHLPKQTCRSDYIIKHGVFLKGVCLYMYYSLLQLPYFFRSFSILK
jgi:hypothetical protein